MQNMKNFSEVGKRVEQLVSNYRNSRIARSGAEKSKIAPAVELMLFLYSRKSALSNQGLVSVFNILKEYKYEKGILRVDEELFLLSNYKETVECCVSILNGDASLSLCLQPQDLTMVISHMVKDKKSIYNPFAGLNSYSIFLNNSKVEGEEINPFIWALGQIRLHAHEVVANIKCDDSAENLYVTSKKFDAIVCTPPFGMKDYPEDALISDLLEHIHENGKIVIVVAANFLSADKFKGFRKELIDNNLVKSVTLLPKYAFSYSVIATAILELSYCNESVSFADFTAASSKRGFSLFELAKRTDFSFDDLDNGFANLFKIVDTKTVESKDYNLNPLLFQVSTPKDGISLSQLVDVISSNPKHVEGKGVVISKKDLSSRITGISIKGSNADINRRCVIIDRSAVLWYHSEAEDLVGFIEESQLPAYALENIAVLCPKNGYTADFVMWALLLDSTKEQVNALSYCYAFPRIRKDLVDQIIVPNVPEEQRDHVVAELAKASMTEMEKKLDAAYSEYQREIHSRKHAMGQTVSSMSALWNRFDRYRKSHNGIINLDDTIGQVNKITISELFDSLSYKINTLIRQTENLADVEYNWGETENVEVSDFIRDYVSNHKDNRFEYSYDLGIETSHFAEGEEYEINGEKKVATKGGRFLFYFNFAEIQIPKRALERVFDNIISNAVHHGFKDSNESYMIGIHNCIENGKAVIEISNNGLPLDSNSTTENVLTYGYSTALNQSSNTEGHTHSGIGGYDTKNIVTKFGGSIEVISTPDEEFTVTYRLCFPIVEKEE